MFLDKIVATKKLEVERLKQTTTFGEMEQHIEALSPCRNFAKALKERSRRPMGLIAEVKKASPSKGLIREDFDPVALAAAYEKAGADCISVLTDKEYFQGANAYLQAVRKAVDTPLLRKDFTIDPMQIFEARCIGADAILLIAAILNDRQLSEFHQLAHQLGMDVLVEVHDQEELERVLNLPLELQLLGINNRNLKTFETDLSTTEGLIKHIPSDVLVVSESGISQPQEIDWLLDVGAKAVLVGEHFMRQPQVGPAIEQLLGKPIEVTGEA